jgi:hypothetical protein
MNDILNERGVFIVTIYRSILMKLINRDISDIVESHMSDSQIGSRRNKSVRNHIWVLNAVITEALSKKDKTPVDVQVLDVKQCFDGLWTKECLNDVFQAGVQDEKLALIYEASKSAHFAVKTPVGLTKRSTVKEKILQGDVLASRLCSVQIDSVGKECLEESKYLYMYKDVVGIPPLGMVDDLVCISECGPKTVMLNSFVKY